MSETITITKHKLKEIMHNCVKKGELKVITKATFSLTEYYKKILKEIESEKENDNSRGVWVYAKQI